MLSDGAVAVDVGEIVAVGPTDEVTDAYAGRWVLDATDHAVAAALFCTEALRAGLTTVVELPESFLLTDDDHERIVDAKLETYAAAGLRNVYAPAFEDEGLAAAPANPTIAT